MDEKTSKEHKFLQDSGMTFQQVFRFAFGDGFIPLMRRLEKELREDRFMEILRQAASQAAAQRVAETAKHAPGNDLATFTEWARDPVHFWKHVLTFDVVEDTNAAFEIKVTECLWAHTFRQDDASDIGYAVVCHPDYAMCMAFNPKIKMIRTKTLIQGDDCCNHRWIWEE